MPLNYVLFVVTFLVSNAPQPQNWFVNFNEILFNDGFVKGDSLRSLSFMEKGIGLPYFIPPLANILLLVTLHINKYLNTTLIINPN